MALSWKNTANRNVKFGQRRMLRIGHKLAAITLLLGLSLWLLTCIPFGNRTITFELVTESNWFQISEGCFSVRSFLPSKPGFRIRLESISYARTMGVRMGLILPYYSRPKRDEIRRSGRRTIPATSDLFVFVPMWLCVSISGVVLWSLRTSSQDVDQKCPQCGYDVRSITAPRCPECNCAIACGADLTTVSRQRESNENKG